MTSSGAPTAAYVDTSCLVCIAFGEPGAEELARDLEGIDELFASNLLEAEFRSALAREEVLGGGEILATISWVMPHRPLSPELERVLSVGYGRGADIWHLATALYLSETPEELPFFTLDERQKRVASELGFPANG